MVTDLRTKSSWFPEGPKQASEQRKEQAIVWGNIRRMGICEWITSIQEKSVVRALERHRKVEARSTGVSRDNDWRLQDFNSTRSCNSSSITGPFSCFTFSSTSKGRTASSAIAPRRALPQKDGGCLLLLLSSPSLVSFVRSWTPDKWKPADDRQFCRKLKLKRMNK
jgi:hypothetical protein